MMHCSCEVFLAGSLADLTWASYGCTGRSLTWWWNGIWYPDYNNGYNNGYSSNNSELLTLVNYTDIPLPSWESPPSISSHVPWLYCVLCWMHVCAPEL